MTRSCRCHSDALFVSAPTAVIDDAPRMTVPHAQQDPEQAIHALATTSDGWLAVGSMTEAGVPGHSTLWDVSIDGAFGPGQAIGRDITPELAFSAPNRPRWARYHARFGKFRARPGEAGAEVSVP